MVDVAVAVSTLKRPDQIEKCLEALDAARAHLPVNEDVNFDPNCIWRLFETYRLGPKDTVVAGSTNWNSNWSTPRLIRRIGYSRRTHADETPDYLVGSVLLYPKAIIERLRWNDRINSSDDIFMGSVLRTNRIEMVFNALV
jgi:hypothetical protein